MHLVLRLLQQHSVHTAAPPHLSITPPQPTPEQHGHEFPVAAGAGAAHAAPQAQSRAGHDLPRTPAMHVDGVQHKDMINAQHWHEGAPHLVQQWCNGAILPLMVQDPSLGMRACAALCSRSHAAFCSSSCACAHARALPAASCVRSIAPRAADRSCTRLRVEMHT